MANLLIETKRARGGAAFVPSFLFYAVAILTAGWLWWYYSHGELDRVIGRDWFLSKEYRETGKANFTVYLFVRDMLVAFGRVCFSITLLYFTSVFAKRTRFLATHAGVNNCIHDDKPLHLYMINLQNFAYFAQTVAIGIFAWCVLDMFWEWFNHKTGKYWMVFSAVELVLFVARSYYKPVDPLPDFNSNNRNGKFGIDT